MRNSFQLTDRYESGGAGLYSSVDDYSRFADAMANGGIGTTGAQILKPETIDLMVHNFRLGCFVGGRIADSFQHAPEAGGGAAGGGHHVAAAEK